ncbi:hypothetical protein OVA24_13905 [Luteolibacter sp. SL250]|uniref:hypothetical protein n=1 Tax=Luteolibacter sp. SL250 TaxID=2995170 RepID=UPI00226FD8D0|nr:hypothetical protein [Luteolibacter sp. SL250]WAC18328.1 hypothetical protein OVA24_13905 [Luteolibacter sp. SL250]
MATAEDQIQKPAGWDGTTLWIISVGIFLVILAYGIPIAASHTNLREGLQVGLINGVFIGTGVSILYLIWCALVCVASRKRWKPWRKLLLLFPQILMFGSVVVSLVTNPPTAKNAFRQAMKAPFPDKSQNLRYHSWGGGITDRTTVWCFETTPEAVEKLIDEISFDSKKVWSPGDPGSFPGNWPFPDAPDLQRWKGSERHEGQRRSSFRHLIIDKERRLVYACYSSY